MNFAEISMSTELFKRIEEEVMRQGDGGLTPTVSSTAERILRKHFAMEAAPRPLHALTSRIVTLMNDSCGADKISDILYELEGKAPKKDPVPDYFWEGVRLMRRVGNSDMVVGTVYSEELNGVNWWTGTYQSGNVAVLIHKHFRDAQDAKAVVMSRAKEPG